VAEGQLRVSFELVAGSVVTVIQANTTGASGAGFEIQLSDIVNLSATDFA
jgi:hypothetical protein